MGPASWKGQVKGGKCLEAWELQAQLGYAQQQQQRQAFAGQSHQQAACSAQLEGYGWGKGHPS
eukprot:2723100-Alexandrium_andersonii.AAC.1